MPRILLGISGLTPQVITETVYALAVAAPLERRWLPDEIRVLTTRVGRERLVQALFQPAPDGRSVWQQLLCEHGLPPIRFGPDTVHVIGDGEGAELDDIRTREDNVRMADAITGHVRALTADPAVELHVSLAGGRKTMGYYAGYALSLFGRPQDRLSHVLVSEPYEALPGFFFPTREACALQGRDGRVVDASQAQVGLADLPFVRLRSGLPKALLQGDASFADTVAAAETARQRARITLHLAACSATLDGRSLKLPPKLFALLVVLAQRALDGQAPLPVPSKEVQDEAWADSVIASLRKVWGRASLPESIETSLRRHADGQTVSADLSKLRRRLSVHLSPERLADYLRSSTRPARHWMPLEPAAIHIEREPHPSASLPKRP